MSLLEQVVYCYETIKPFQTAMAVSVIFLYLLYLYLRDMNIPPGPRGVPLLGYWPFLGANSSHLHLQKLSKKYGDVFSFRVAGKLFIHLGSIKSIKEAHLTKSEYFGGRFTEDSVLYYAFNESVVFLNGEQWKVVRKFFVSKFKEFGMNAVKENAASSVYDALKETVEELRNAEGQPIQITDLIIMKCMLIMRRIIFNDQGITKEELQTLTDLYSEVMKGMTSTNMMLIGTFPKYCMFPFIPSVRKLKSCVKQIEDIFLEVINRHKSEYNESDVADLIDCYFKEREERRRKGDPTARHLTDKALISSVGQFVTDGVLTLGTFIGSFLVTLVEYPEEQNKIYKEIIEVIGTDRLPTLEDKIKLPYTNAFISEVIRFSDVIPIFPSLQCTKETTVQGYKIPEGSITLLNLYSAHRNPNNFENPDEFNPSRYLTSPDKQRPDLPLVFGVGKRNCIGEAFSMIQTFLYVTTIVQNFKLSLPESCQGTNVMFWSTEKLKICAHPRSHKPHSKST